MFFLLKINFCHNIIIEMRISHVATLPCENNHVYEYSDFYGSENKLMFYHPKTRHCAASFTC